MISDIEWPLLLRHSNYLQLVTKSCNFFQKNIKLWSIRTSKIKSEGLIMLDKPLGCNSYQITSWLKDFLKVKKILTMNLAKSNLTGCQLILLGKTVDLSNVNLNQSADFVIIFKLNAFYGNISASSKQSVVFDKKFFRCSPHFYQIKKYLKLKTIKDFLYIEFDIKKQMGIIEISVNQSLSCNMIVKNCELFSKKSIDFLEFRKIRIGYLSENETLSSFHDIIDAIWLKRCIKKYFYWHKVLFPFDIIFLSFRRIMIKDSCINAICYGAHLLNCGVFKIETGIEKNEEILIISQKGEPIAIGRSKINGRFLLQTMKGKIVDIKKVLMEKDKYPKKWHLGHVSTKKNIAVCTGLRSFCRKQAWITVKWWERSCDNIK